jgi:hypothetical protein
MSSEEPLSSFSLSSRVSLWLFSCQKFTIWPGCCLPTSCVWTRKLRKRPKSLLRRSWYWGSKGDVQVVLEVAPCESAFWLGTTKPTCRISERFLKLS